MSGGDSCQCEERQKPMAQRAWFVVDYKCNYSAFNGYKYTNSDYSSVCCHACRRTWRTKAGYVEDLIGAGKKL